MSGRSKRLSLDRYVWLATRGLPKRVRLDTAAELRVHLLERIRALEGQGFPRSEAEHVAVSEMGLPEGTNRAFLKHFFTFKTGWIVLGLAALSAGIWWGKDNLFPRATGVQALPLDAEDLSHIISDSNLRPLTDFKSITVVVPAGAVGIETAVLHNGVPLTSRLFSPTPFAGQVYDGGKKKIPVNYRHEAKVIVGFGESTYNCLDSVEVSFTVLPKNFVDLVTRQSFGSSCVLPRDGYGTTLHETHTYVSATADTFDKLELNKESRIWGARFGPNLGRCQGENGYIKSKHCNKRVALAFDVVKNPLKHMDREFLLVIRAVDAKSRDELARIEEVKKPR